MTHPHPPETPNTTDGKKLELRLLSTGSIKPSGWLLKQMQIDLKDGLKGNFPKISNNVSQNLFANQNRKPGIWVKGSRERQEKSWWAGEHEGYWIDSLLRSAILTEDEGHIEYVRQWMERVLAKYEETGYIGIYDAQSRFPDKGFDGELWTQSRAFQAMLAWYEYGGDERILDAVKATVRLTIDHYREAGTYFGREEADGGVTHGVGYMDTLEWLWRLTEEDYFAEAAVWLYADYSDRTPETFTDMTVASLCDPDFPWCDHGAHIGEALHMPAVAFFHSGNEIYDAAARQVLPKLTRHTNPSGGMSIGYLEAVAASKGGGHTLNENCAHTQALMSLNRILQYRPDAAIGEWQEACIYNVVQGARFHPVDRAVIYLSKDNRYHASDPEAHGARELFSACHEPAACCVLNVPRVTPYYVESMWLTRADESGLYLNSYGPNEIKTTLRSVELKIRQITEYPFDDKTTFEFELAEPLEFSLTLRVPTNAGKLQIDAGEDAVVERSKNHITITKTWQSRDAVKIDFDFQVVRKIQQDGREAYWQWGPLVFALPFETEETIHTDIDATPDIPSGFHEYLLTPKSAEGWDLIAGRESEFHLVRTEGDADYPWSRPPVALEGSLKSREGKPVKVRLQPLGCSPLRRTTFPMYYLVPAQPGESPNTVTVDQDPMRAF